LDPEYLDRIEVVMHQKSGAFFTGLFGSSLDQDGAQSVAYHFAANQPFPFALFSSTMIGKDSLEDSGQMLVNTWNDTSGYHLNPSVTFNGGYAPSQPESLQLVG
jgi:hypothetical protein